jgi:hypothetical protein
MTKIWYRHTRHIQGLIDGFIPSTVQVSSVPEFEKDGPMMCITDVADRLARLVVQHDSNLRLV